MSRADVTTGSYLDFDGVRPALATSNGAITAEQLAVLRGAAACWLAQEEARQFAVTEVRAFAVVHGVRVR